MHERRNSVTVSLVLVYVNNILPRPMHCRAAVLPIVDGLGTGLSFVRSDINGNLTRIETKYESDKAKYAKLLDIPRSEKSDGCAMDTSSTTNALMWLTRAHVFIIALLKKLAEDDSRSVGDAAGQAYNESLSKYHGWVIRNAVRVALTLVPSRESFFAKLG